MNNVMHKAQELAEAIVESSVYQRMHAAELQVNKDEEAVKAVSDFVEKRQKVENIRAMAEDIASAIDGLIESENEDTEEQSEEVESDLSAQAQSADGQAKASDAELLEFYKQAVKDRFKE